MCAQNRRAIAIIDDDPGVRDSLRFLLETAGHAVETYDSGPRFLSEAKPAQLACLVLDQQMPLISGLELLARLRAGGLATPSLLVTSLPAAALAERAAELGVAVIEKPLAQDDLLAAIEALLV
jgi:two-component system response regulator FixJ